jgi:uncharacterized protein YndB with AHSA1/START domain
MAGSPTLLPVRFTHSNLRDEESARSHEEGWTTCFDNLEQALAVS